MKSNRREFLLSTAAATLLPTVSTAAAKSAPSPQTLWSKRKPFPTPDQLTRPHGVRDLIVHRAGADEYDFLHDSTIVEHRGMLFAAWYNCPEREIVDASLIRGRRSRDGGITWSDVETIAEDSDRKIFYVAGTLSTGQHYLLSNTPGRAHSRDLLTIAVTRPGEAVFSKMWKLRDGYAVDLKAGPEWSYPSAIEHGGKLFVVYTSEKHHCALSVIPIASIAAND